MVSIFVTPYTEKAPPSALLRLPKIARSRILEHFRPGSRIVVIDFSALDHLWRIVIKQMVYFLY